jgi:hypothetical protein
MAYRGADRCINELYSQKASLYPFIDFLTEFGIFGARYSRNMSRTRAKLAGSVGKSKELNDIDRI